MMRIFARIAGALFLIAAAIHPAYAGSAYTGNSYYLGGSTWASPQAIGNTTPNTGAFTDLSSSGTVSGLGFSRYLTLALTTPPVIGITTPNVVYASPLNFDVLRNMSGGKLLVSNGTISIASGFGTGSGILVVNTTAAFEVSVGTGGTASSGVISLPTAANGWTCSVTDVTTPQTNRTAQSGISVNSVTVVNYNGGVQTAWPASDILLLSCFAF